MLLHTVILGIARAVSVAAAPASEPSDDCIWQVLFPWVPCIDEPPTPPHDSNDTTSPHNCYQSMYTGACVYCGTSDGKPALVSTPKRRKNILSEHPKGHSINLSRRPGRLSDIIVHEADRSHTWMRDRSTRRPNSPIAFAPRAIAILRRMAHWPVSCLDQRYGQVSTGLRMRRLGWLPADVVLAT